MNEKVLNILRSFLPEALSERIASDPQHLDRIAEQRWVTVLFADITGFTPLCERLSPEEVMALLNKLFSGLVFAIRRHGGVVDKFLGDAVMALFGAPVAHPDDPKRAISAALEMINHIKRFNRSAAMKRTGIKISMSIGINSGFVVSGLVGDERHREYTAIGDAVNIAARLEQNAEPWEIIVSKTTMERAQNEFAFESKGKIKLKGKSELQPIWSVIGERVSAKISVEERAFFANPQLERFIKNALSSSGHFGIIGDPTTLGYWRRFILSINPDTILIQPVAGRGFSLVEAILKKIPPPEGKDEKAKLKYIEKLRLLVSEKISEKVVLIFHAELTDDRSIEVLRNIDGCKIFWFGETLPAINLTKCKAKNFSKKLLSQRLKEIFSARAVSRDMIERIWGITHGIPGHIWHIVRFLYRTRATSISRGVLRIKAELELPADLSAYAIAQLDALPPKARDAIISASVLGERFPKNVFVRMIGKNMLSVIPDGIFEEQNGYIRFRWELLQKAAYSSLTAPTRRRLHLDAATAYRRAELTFSERIPPEIAGKYGVRRAKQISAQKKLQSIAPELGYHYERCGRWKEAFKFLIIAGEQQRERWSYREALGFFGRAQKIADKMLPVWKNISQYVDLLFTQGEMCLNLGEYTSALNMNRRAARLSLKYGDSSLLYGALMRIAVIFSQTGKIPYAEKLYERALKLLDELPPNPHGKLQLMMNIGVIRANQNRLDEAKQMFIKALRLAREIEKEEEISSLLTNLGWIFERQKRYKRAIRLHQIAVKIDRKRKDILSEAQDLVNLAIALNGIGESEDAISALRRSKELFEKISDPLGLAFALNCLGEFMRGNAEIEQIIRLHRKALKLAKQSGDPFITVDILYNLAVDYDSVGDFQKARNYLLRAEKVAKASGDDESIKKIYTALKYMKLNIKHNK